LSVGEIDLTADPAPVADLVQRQMLAAWLAEVESGDMPRWRLFDVRGRIDPLCGEFPPQMPGLDELRLAVMAALGVRLGDLPESDPLPDRVPDDFA
jgi:hypothetical protein